MTRFGRAHVAVAGVAAIALVLGGFTVASNLGFKFVPSVGANSFFNLSIPSNNAYTTTSGFFNDTNGEDPGVIGVRKVETNFNFTNWFDGAGPGNDRAIVAGEAVILEAGAGGISAAVIVGSHNPNQTFDFTASEFFNFAVPYHGTLGTTSEFFNEINNQLGAGAISGIRKVESNFNFTNWFDGAGPGNDRAITLGEGVIIEAGTGGTGFIAPHY